MINIRNYMNIKKKVILYILIIITNYTNNPFI